MDVNKVCKMLLGEPEKVIIEGQELEAFPLDPLEWIKVLELNPQNLPDMTLDERQEYNKSGGKKSPPSLIRRITPADQILLFRQKLYVLEVTLIKNDKNFDKGNIMMNLCDKLTPLFNKVMEITQAPEEIKKKVDSPK